METQKYMRRPFSVDAVRVTAENFDEVAAWCNGERKLTRPKSAPSGDTGQRPYIHINVNRPLTPKQAMAFVGDWILYAGTGFKVFTDKAFHKTFVASYTEVVATPTVVQRYLVEPVRPEFVPRLSDEMSRGGLLPAGVEVQHNEEGIRSIVYGRASGSERTREVTDRLRSGVQSIAYDAKDTFFAEQTREEHDPLPPMTPAQYDELSINTQRRMAGLPSYPGPAEDMTITEMPIYRDVVGDTLSADNHVHLANLEDGQ